MRNTEELVTSYVKLWPREVFYIQDSQCKAELKEALRLPGVYILHQDFDVFYVGKSDSLFSRLNGHAEKRYKLWNHFSAFVVPKKDNLDYVEAIMIAATPRIANKRGGRNIGKINLPNIIERKLFELREIV
jgi:hypothetical protein